MAPYPELFVSLSARKKTMKTIARTFYKMPVNVMFFTAVPIFFFLFVLAYKPFDIDTFLAVGKGHYALNLIVATLIVLGVMVFSRMLLFILKRIIDLNWSLYVLWCVGEVILCGLFLSIPMGIGWAGVRPYFGVMSLCVLYMAGILVFPLSIISMAVQLHVLVKRLESAPVVDEKTLIRFQDEQKRLKLVVSSEAVLYIEAEENYVHIVHLDNGKVKDFELRSSMRALEEILQRHGLVRCHRSFFVNAAHVDLLKKDANGYALAQLDQHGVKNIPVSKKYYDAIVSLL
jgi:hypothetical protein